MSEKKETNVMNIKQYICKICLELDRNDLVSILNYINGEHVNTNLFNDNYDGIKIDLDLLESRIILKLYDYILFKISKK